MASRRLVSLGLALCAAAACRHVEPPAHTVTPPLTKTCPLDTAPPVLRIEAGAPHVISGILVQGTSTARADGQYALADLQLPDGRVIRHDADGGFRFDSLQAGRYVLRVRALGHNARVDTLRLTDAVGLQLIVPVTPVANDACGFGEVTIPLGRS